ncbi:B12-binding domain-containing radical SAM protein [Methyloferula stellata]|uniref:B12-binding domain-containing radical SAM protein n=1 Tax=Methyloferula stellata TaxID=876270 RepID=UPI000373E803|nr:B12-binding domain-containing radical SAM protein [Methyloferula stellata]
MDQAFSNRRIALVCLTPKIDAQELRPMHMPSFGIRRIQAAIIADPALQGAAVALIDRGAEDLTSYVDDILAFDPDIVGFSIYVWSAPFLIGVAQEIKRRRPSLTVVFGGPSARTSFLGLRPYRPAQAYLDIVVEGDGEEIFADIAKLPELTRQAFEKMSGLALPTQDGWTKTEKRAPILALDSLASPYQLGLMPQGAVAYLETFRGCPLSCRFCEWGSKENPKAAFSTDYIARELDAFQRSEAPAVFLLDAGLNLNLQAFRNLQEANEQTGFFKEAQLWAEIYPSIIRDEHLAFLENVGSAYLGVGMQSMDPAVLEKQDRPFDAQRFEAAVRALAEHTEIELQIIMGLPGDTPEGFRRTFAYAQSLPADVRVYHCLVLPDALLTRSLPEWQIRFDPKTLILRSCLGWSEEAIAAMRQELQAYALANGGKAGDFWWSFRRPKMRRLAG